MNKLKSLLTIFALLFCAQAFAQFDGRLKLSTDYPQAGEKIKIDYTPLPVLAKMKDTIKATIYYFNRKQNAEEISLKPEGNSWKGEFTVDDSAKAFMVKLSVADSVDNNAGKGFTYLVFKGKQPIKGAYLAKAEVFFMTYTFNLLPDSKQAIADIKKEFELYPENREENQFSYYYLLNVSKDAGNKEIIKQKLASLKNAATEKDMAAEATLYRYLNQNKQSDSVREAAMKRFPNGDIFKNQYYAPFYHERNLAKKDSIYQLMYSANKGNVPDYFTLALAIEYLKAAQFDKYKAYKSKVKDTLNIESQLNDVAYGWAQSGLHLPEAERLSKESLDIISKKMEHPVSSNFMTANQVRKQLQSSYYSYADTYNYILYQEGKYAEAAKLQEPVWEANKLETDINEHYAVMLTAVKNYDKATSIIEATIKAGKESDALKKALKTCYDNTKGSDSGFDSYLAALENTSRQNVKDSWAKQMISEPAPGFNLKDLNGNTVSLAGLKGKTVVVDFWATWCGPCKASMPGMQKAVDKYKNDPNVAFLFIDTWENGDDYLPGVKKFIADNKYTFNVLLDDKDSDGKQAKVVSQYRVEGIPTKFVIDKAGNIRFKYSGYSGTADALADEVSAMVELVQEAK